MLLLSVGTLAASASDGVQAAGQSATNEQQASAASGATQIDPSNTNIDVRVLSPGNNGSVTRPTRRPRHATASNSNDADQSTSQNQGGSGGIQTANQWAGNTQLAGALSTASPVRGDEHEHSGSRSQPRQQRQRHAVERRELDRELDEPQRDRPGRRPEPGRRPLAVARVPRRASRRHDQSAGDGQAGAALSGATQAAPANAS